MDSIVSTLVRILEAVFIIGLVGSAAVLVLTSIEDIKELLLGKENHEPGVAAVLPLNPSTPSPSTGTTS